MEPLWLDVTQIESVFSNPILFHALLWRNASNADAMCTHCFGVKRWKGKLTFSAKSRHAVIEVHTVLLTLTKKSCRVCSVVRHLENGHDIIRTQGHSARTTGDKMLETRSKSISLMHLGYPSLPTSMPPISLSVHMFSFHQSFLTWFRVLSLCSTFLFNHRNVFTNLSRQIIDLPILSFAWLICTSGNHYLSWERQHSELFGVGLIGSLAVVKCELELVLLKREMVWF